MIRKEGVETPASDPTPRSSGHMAKGRLTSPTPSPASLAASYVRLVRPKHWIKSGGIAVPLFFTPSSLSWASILEVSAAIAAFSFVSSAIYIVNDCADRKADALHPLKRHRPIASGSIPVRAALLLSLGLLALGVGIGAMMEMWFLFLPYLFSYIVLNIFYSFWLKHFSIVDLCAIALGFILRVHAGIDIISSEPSPWISIITGLVALFLAVAKRRDDLVLGVDAKHRGSLGGYTLTFLDLSVALLLGALLVSYLIYTTDGSVLERYGTSRLHYTAPFVAMGILRYLQITIVEEKSGSPTDIILSDRFLLMTCLAWIVSVGIFIYG